MTSYTEPIPPVDVLGCLRRQNLYQRLGLKTNHVGLREIKAAYGQRIQLLQSCESELSSGDFERAENLIDEAYRTLSFPEYRQRYDAQLVGQHLVKAELVTEPSGSDLLLGRFQIGQLLTGGQRCNIHEALDTRLNRPVIVKRVREELSAIGNHAQLFRQEAELFAQCNASNLVKILDYDVASNSLILERMSHDLEIAAREGKYDQHSIVDFLRDSLAGLVTLHKQGIAHGRVELKHLLADEDGRIKLAVTPGMTGLGAALCPSPDVRHVAPELLNGNVYGNPSLAIDIYALGFAALELLCGNRLARRVSPALAGDQPDTNGWLLWHSSPTDHLPTIRELVPNLSPALGKLIERMTCKQQQDRFPDAKSCLAALNEGYILPAPRLDDVEQQLSDEGIEILGTPPALHDPYEANNRLSWAQVLKNPALLLAPQGRAHLAFACVVCLMSLSAAVLLFQPAATIDQARDLPPHPSKNGLTASAPRLPVRKTEPQVEEAAPVEDARQHLPTLTSVETNKIVPEPIAFDLAERRRSVYLRVVPRGRVLSIEGEREEHGLPTHWKLKPGTYTTHCIDDDSSQEFDFSFDVVNGEGSLLVHIPVPPKADSAPLAAETIDPYADVRGLTYFPGTPAFELQGAKSIEIADRQFAAIENAMLELSRRPYLQEAQAPFALPPQAVDPRASFALALWAYRTADMETAVGLCRKSLTDAVGFEVPFVLPLRLMNHIQINHAKTGGLTAALADCRQTLQQFKRLELSRGKPVFENSVAEIAWWSGILIGYATDVKRESFQNGLDVQAFETALRRTCTPVQWEKYRIGRLDVSKRHHLLAQHRAGPSSLAPFTDFEKPDTLPLTSAGYASAQDTLQSGRANSEEHTQEKFDKSHVISHSSPLLFANYRPFDLSSLASEALSTLKPASQVQFVFR